MIVLGILISLTLLLCVIFRILNKRKAKKEEQIWKEKNQLFNKVDYFICKVKSANKLKDLHLLHTQIWANGIRCENFGPSEYGMFRTNDILMMSPEQIYLGNIWGLWTKPLTFWETCEIDDRKLVIEQYRNVLLSNLQEIKRKILD